MTEPNPAPEQWRAVPGYVGLYEVSDQGRVRSLDRIIKPRGRRSYLKPGRVLRPGLRDAAGRVHVVLSVGGEHAVRTVHRLVLEAFVGPRPPGQEACHGPGGAADNRRTNLRWDTHEANVQDSIRDGTHYSTSRVACPRGHALVAPNLTPNITRDGNRSCYACSLTFAWAKARALRPADPDWIAEAHRRHAEIVHFGEPLRYSNSGRQIRWTP